MPVNKIVVKIDGVITKTIDFNALIAAQPSGTRTITVEAYNGNTLINSQTRNITVPTSDLVMDTFPNVRFGLSVRKLRNTYAGHCMRVRRSSDNAEENIGFSSGVLNETALLNHIGSGDGFVTRWNDQSTFLYNAIQTNASLQPQIASSGVINKVNGMPALDFGTTTQPRCLEINHDLAGYLKLFAVQTIRNYDTSGNVLFGSNVGGVWYWQVGNTGGYLSQGVNIGGNYPLNNGSQRLLTYYATSTSNKTNVNGTEVASGSAPTAIASGARVWTIGKWAGGTSHDVDGTMQEVLGWTDNALNIAGVENNINADFNIYP